MGPKLSHSLSYPWNRLFAVGCGKSARLCPVGRQSGTWPETAFGEPGWQKSAVAGLLVVIAARVPVITTPLPADIPAAHPQTNCSPLSSPWLDFVRETIRRQAGSRPRHTRS